ncbi:transglycosylase SLT domain-containing protein, partial [Enterobacter hormaechei]
NPHVTSSAKAAGLWQFVPVTANYYGLAQNQWYDGRRDVVASTNAALDLLERLYIMFDSDWPLALAAYN